MCKRVLNVLKFISRTFGEYLIETVAPFFHFVNRRVFNIGQCLKTVQEPVWTGRSVSNTKRNQDLPVCLNIELTTHEWFYVQKGLGIRCTTQQFRRLPKMAPRVLQARQSTEFDDP